ncbi:quinate permease [Colletotrichum orchidophilum]|uniref:Quinate permease n=1 Tax=Colletotrichum orchidophilum TaxID=1209926 RepID=A0A1G4B4N1_9PEZI|nr:quinate permease [Colletotrichum orchidophilum]OHE96232.1 quinate permease [Colletotrichum orchidophilum]
MGFNLHADGTNDPEEVRNWRNHMRAVTASMMGYDTSVIGGTMALDSFRRDFDLADSSPTFRDTLQGNIVSTFQAGCFFGALLTFLLAGWLGRKRAIMISALVFLVGGTLMTASLGEIGLLLAGRAITGLGIGATSLIVPWIVPLGLQLLPGVLLFFGISICPESPRWLAKKDGWEDAKKVLVHIRKLPADHDYVSTEINYIKRQVEDSSVNHMNKAQMFKRLFEKGSRSRIAIGLFLMACQNLTGVNIITYHELEKGYSTYSPRIFETLAITGMSNKLFATGFYGIAKTLGMVIFTVWLAEKVGRRNGLIWAAFIGSLPIWYIGGFTFLADPAGQAAAGNTDRNARGYIAMLCVYLCGLIYCATWHYVVVLQRGVQPRRPHALRRHHDRRSGSFVVSRTTPYMITSLGYGMYMFFGTLVILMGVWAFLFVLETKAPVLGLTLEDMDLLFMRSMHTTVWTALRERKSAKDVLADTSPAAAVHAPYLEEKEVRLEYMDTVEYKSVTR